MAFWRRRHEQDHQQAPDARAHLDAVGSEPVESDAGDQEPLSVQSVLETDIKDVVRAVGSYLHSPTDELRNALLKEIEILDGQIDLGDWYSSRLRVPPLGAISSVIGRTSDIDSAMAVPSDVFNEQVALVKAAKAEVTEPSEESLAELRTAFDALSPRYG